MFLAYEYNKRDLFFYSNSTLIQKDYYFNGPSIGFSYKNLEQKKLDISPSGQEGKVSFTHYLSNSTNTNYDETFVRIAHHQKKWLPERHVLSISAQARVTEDNGRGLLLGTSSNDIEYLNAFAAPGEGFITRGYPSGQFIGYTMASGILEYRFPISQQWRGPDNPSPYYMKRIHGAVFVETLTLDGKYFDDNDLLVPTTLHKYFTTAGGELRFDTTVLYHAPLTFRVILAYGFEDTAEGGPTVQFGIQAPQIF